MIYYLLESQLLMINLLYIKLFKLAT